MNETQRGRVDAVAQSALILGTVVEDMPEMAVAVDRSHFGADHAVRLVRELIDVRGLDRLGKAGPAAARIEFGGGRKQRLARHDVDVDAWLVVVQVLARS